MTTFKRQGEIVGIAFCGLFMATLACAQPAAPGSEKSSFQDLPDDYELGCMEETTIQIAGRDEVITVHEAEKIRLIVVEYLEREKPAMEPSVFWPTEAFIDCWGTVRFGAWILGSGSSHKPELDLTFYIFSNEHFRVWQGIGLIREEGQWRVTGAGRSTAHLRY
jgi:hypothetical protein